jgi:glycosyltransferase involved in cell wall biosynthesis
MGGAEYSLLELLSGLGRFPVELHVAVSPGDPLHKHIIRLPVHGHKLHLPYLKKSKTFTACLRALKTVCTGAVGVYRLCRKERIQTVYCNTFRVLPFCLSVKWFSRIRIVCHCRDNIRSARQGRFIRYMSDDAIAVSVHICRQLSPANNTCRIHTVHNGVNLSRFTPADNTAPVELRKKYCLPDDVMLIGNIGQIFPWKNQRDYIHVAGKLLQHNRKLHFFIVGPIVDADYFFRLCQQIQAWDLQSYFTFTGEVEDIVSYITGFSVLLHTAHDEPFGRVLTEAAASSVPVIAYASGGASEIVEDGRTGYLIPEGEVERMAELTASLLYYPALRKSMGERALERAVTLFDGKDYVQNMYKLLAHD